MAKKNTTSKKPASKTKTSKDIKKPEKKSASKEKTSTKKNTKEETEKEIREEENENSSENNNENSENSEEEENEISEQKNEKSRELQNEKGIDHPSDSCGVVYVGHLPWGFIDETLKKYFSQFGNITRIICPKSSKTGRSVGYAFIEFDDEETARIAAKTMDNYIIFEKILKCSFVEDKSKYDRIFLKWKKKFEFNDKYKKHCEKLNKKESEKDVKIRIQGLLDREEQKREKLQELGIDYKYKGFKEIVEEYKKKNKISETKSKKSESKKEEENDNKKKIETVKKQKKVKEIEKNKNKGSQKKNENKEEKNMKSNKKEDAKKNKKKK